MADSDGEDSSAGAAADSLQQPPSLPTTFTGKEDYLTLYEDDENEDEEPQSKAKAKQKGEDEPIADPAKLKALQVQSVFNQALETFTSDVASAPLVSAPSSPTLPSKKAKPEPETVDAPSLSSSSPRLRKREPQHGSIVNETKIKKEGAEESPAAATVAPAPASTPAPLDLDLGEFTQYITKGIAYVSAFWHTIMFCYHMCCYQVATAATRLSLKVHKRFPQFIPQILAWHSRPTHYSYVGKTRHNAIWYTWIALFIKNILRLWAIASLVFWLITPPTRYVANVLRSNEIDIFNMNEPLESMYMADYISDYSNTASLSATEVDRRRNRQYGIEDAQTEEEKEALRRYDTRSLDGDDYPDEAQMLSMEMSKQLILKNPTSGLAAFDALIYGQSLSIMDMLGVTKVVSLFTNMQVSAGPLEGGGDGEFQLKFSLPDKVDPLLPSPNLLCDFMGQYRRVTQNIVLKKGCYDMNKFYLDYTYNKLAICEQAKDPQMMVLAEKRGNEHVKQLSEFLRACEQVRAEYKAEQRRKLGDSELTCACSADYGAAELWAYSTIPGREAHYIIDYSVVARSYQETEEDNPLDLLATFNLNPSRDTKVPLERTDLSFWEHIGATSSMRQPRDFVRFKGRILPSEQNKTDYFGPNYGTTLNAWLSGMTAVQLDHQNATSSHSIGTFFSTLNYLGTKLNIGDQEIGASSEITSKIIEERSKIASNKRKQKREILDNLQKSMELNQANSGTSTQVSKDSAQQQQQLGGKWQMPTMGEIIKKFVPDHQTQVEIDQDRLLNNNYPTLQEVEIDLNVPHSTCALRCLHKFKLLGRERQKHYDTTILGHPTGSKSYPMPSYVFAEVPHKSHKQQQQQQQVQ